MNFRCGEIVGPLCIATKFFFRAMPINGGVILLMVEILSCLLIFGGEARRFARVHDETTCGFDIGKGLTFIIGRELFVHY